MRQEFFFAQFSLPLMFLLLPLDVFPVDDTNDQQNLTLQKEICLKISIQILRRTLSGLGWGYLVGVGGTKEGHTIGLWGKKANLV